MPWIAFFGSLLLCFSAALFLEVARRLLCNEFIMTRPSPGLLLSARGTLLAQIGVKSWRMEARVRQHSRSSTLDSANKRNARQPNQEPTSVQVPLSVAPNVVRSPPRLVPGLNHHEKAQTQQREDNE